MIRLWLKCAAIVLSLALAGQALAESARKPNVIVIVADDLGYADVGMQGLAKDVKTPHIDSIAAAGVRFTNAYVSAPVCSPSRAGFLTGRYQQRFGHEHNPQPKQDETFGLPVDQATLADVLKQSGYATGALGKWHLGGPERFRPLQRGFDEFYGFLGGAHVYNALGTGTNAILRGAEPAAKSDGYLTEVITREAVAFIDRHKSEPFFLYLPYNAVHTPQQAPPKYVERFAGVTDEKRKMMLAMLASLDDGVGAILQKLRESKLEEQTLVVFISDNGGPTQGNGSNNGPLKGVKGQLWEGGIRIPFAMQWKGRIPEGQVRNEMVITLDIFTTALAAAGATPKEDVKLDGVNLLPWLEKKTADAPHEVLYWRFRPQWAVRQGNYKLMMARDGQRRLFDLSQDIGESKDLSSEKPEIVKDLQAKYDAWDATLMKPRWPGKQEGAKFEPASAASADKSPEKQ